MPDTAYQKGLDGESRAALYLQNRGMVLLARRYRSPFGEIDAILRDGDTLVFVEVKARSTTDYGTPAEFVTPAKRRLLIQAARAYLLEMALMDVPARFDVIEVYLGTDRVHHIENAFDASGW